MEERFRYIFEKMLEDRKHLDLPAEEIASLKQTALVLSKKSTRHHYIPQFFIKAFLGKDQRLSVYDKQRDTIKKARVGPGGVFFENDRNSFSEKDLSISIIEDYLYSGLDSQLSGDIKKLQDPGNEEWKTDSSIDGAILSFLIGLFWRIPATDYAFETIYNNAVIKFPNPETGLDELDHEKELELRNSPFHYKLEKASMFKRVANEIGSMKNPPHAYSFLATFPQDAFVLGDYPMVYERSPGTHTDLTLLDYVIPVSSTRLYSCTKYKNISIGLKDTGLINALIIDQSKRMVCAGNHDLLVSAVRYFRALKAELPLPELKQLLFGRIQKP